MLFLDLDRFKYVNDSWGHEEGDELLVQVAERLQGCIRGEDTVARFGGDEFAILLNHVERPEDALLVAERIQRVFDEPFLVGGQRYTLSASIGIALSTSAYKSAADLMRNADIAMYQAKEQGKACHAVYGEEMHEKIVEFVQLERALRVAIAEDQLELHFQPIVHLPSGRIQGFEALVRWHHPERGFLSPGVFIPVAESTGLIVPMGWWILEEACRKLKRWRERFPHRDLSLSVNLSARQFSLPELPERVRDILQRYDLDPSCLKLEITETAIMENLDAASEILKQLKACEVELYLDDFGTGYSSLSYLHKFPVDVLKIDRSFVSRLEEQSRHFAIVQAIVSLASSLGMRVVAEGVETAEQQEHLRRLQVELAQGYFFSRPLPAEQVEELFAEPPHWSCERSLQEVT